MENKEIKDEFKLDNDLKEERKVREGFSFELDDARRDMQKLVEEMKEETAARDGFAFELDDAQRKIQKQQTLSSLAMDV